MAATNTPASKCKYSLIAAHSFPEYGIGHNGELPWSIPEDMAYFNQITNGHIVIMGRRTWDSLPARYRPLPGRLNIVLTNQTELHTPMALLSNNPDNEIYTWTAPGPDANGNTRQRTRVGPIWTSCEHLDMIVHHLTHTDGTNGAFVGRIPFIIGGSQIYKWALDNLNITSAYITEVYLNEKKNMDSFDTFFPKYDPNNWCNTADGSKLSVISADPIQRYMMPIASNSYGKSSEHRPIYYRFIRYALTNVEQHSINSHKIYSEYQYLDIMRRIMQDGLDRPDRTGTGTLSLFGTQQKYDLSREFPMTTTKRISLRWIFEELMLYISGKTDNKILQEKGIHIWDGNTSRDFLDKRGLTNYPEGDMGETYGFNMRHYGGNYQDCATDYIKGRDGYDQLANVLHLIRTDPTSRRIIINLWNPGTGHRAALPSCLMMYQFYVDTVHHRLNCQIYIRSSDYFLANSWNACTGALLVHLICGLEDINLTPGELTVVTGDTHLYKTHIEQVATNLERQPYLRPQVYIEPTGGRKIRNMEDWKFEDLRLVGYRAYPSIQAPMAV